MMKHFLQITMSILALFASSRGIAQNLYEGNPADPAMLEAVFSNPALNTYVMDRAVLAMTAHQVGIGGGLFSIRSGVLSYHFPWQFRGFALGGQFFAAGLYSQTDFRMSYGKRILPPLSVGVNLDVFSRSFDKSKFYRFDPDDPVFASGYDKVNTSWGLGAVLELHQALSIGAAFEHINRPNLALGNDPYPQPFLFSLGLKWHLRGWNATSMINRLEMSKYTGSEFSHAMDGAPQTTQLGAEIPIGTSLLRVNSDPTVVQVEAEVLLYHGLYVNYRYGYFLTDVNLASVGTQRFGFVYDFNRLPHLSSLPSLPTRSVLQDDLPTLKGKPRGLFFVYADADTVDIIQRHVHRSVDPDISTASLAMIFPEDLGQFSASSPLQEVDLLKVRDPAVRVNGLYSTQYRSALEGIGLHARAEGDKVQPEIISYPGSERRANALANLITGDRFAVTSNVPIYTTDERPVKISQTASLKVGEEIQQVISPKQVTFRLVPIFRSFERSHWSLEIRNLDEKKVYSMSGVERLPDSLTWDWRDANGALVGPGSYSYRLTVGDPAGKIEYSDRGTFEVVHRRQSLTIDVTRQSRVGDVPADKYILIVGGGRSTDSSVPADTTNGNIR